jgi:hypothetical protein
MFVAIMMLMELGNWDFDLTSRSNIQVPMQIKNAFLFAHDLVYFTPTNLITLKYKT